MKEIILNKIRQYNVYILILISTILCLFVSLFFNKQNTAYALEESKQEDNCIIKTIKVDVKGYVVNPGVYEMNETDRVIDVINKAGGLLKEADTTLLNLSENIYDSMVINVYSKEQSETKETECNCSESNSLISINTATAETLDTLPGIGLSKANDIINYRIKNGLFEKIDDVKNVSGIGDSLFEKIKNYITV